MSKVYRLHVIFVPFNVKSVPFNVKSVPFQHSKPPSHLACRAPKSIKSITKEQKEACAIFAHTEQVTRFKLSTFFVDNHVYNASNARLTQDLHKRTTIDQRDIMRRRKDVMPRRKQCHLCKTPTITSEGVQTPNKFFCSLDHAATYARNRLDRLRLNEERKMLRMHKQAKTKAYKAAMSVKRTNTQWQHKLTQQAFNKMRVLEELQWFKDRGLEPVCISCNRPLGNDQWACGHYKTRGGNNALRYDPKNTYLQHNHRCNKMMSGDIHGTASTIGFRQGIINRFSEEQGQALLDYCEQDHQPYTWHWRELEEMRKGFNEKIKSLTEKLDTS